MGDNLKRTKVRLSPCPFRFSFIPHGFGRRDSSGANCREQGGKQSDEAHCNGSSCEGWNVKRGHFKQDALHCSSRCPSSNASEQCAESEQSQAKREKLASDLIWRCAERHPHTNLTTTLRNGISKHAIRADGGQERRHTSEHDSKNRRRPTSDKAVVDASLHGFEAIERQLRIELPD